VIRVVDQDSATSTEACGPWSPSKASRKKLRKARNALIDRTF
jgi:hypothetical protein